MEKESAIKAEMSSGEEKHGFHNDFLDPFDSQVTITNHNDILIRFTRLVYGKQNVHRPIFMCTKIQQTTIVYCVSIMG